jgi:hypothetical protein
MNFSLRNILLFLCVVLLALGTAPDGVAAKKQAGRSNRANPIALLDPTLDAIRRYSGDIRRTVAKAKVTTSGILFASTQFPAVGRLMRVLPTGGSVASCTGTLISPVHFLTAAHCFCENADTYFNSAEACRRADAPSSRLSYVYFPAAGLFSVKTVSLHQDYFRPTDAKGGIRHVKVSDLAIAELTAAVPLNPIKLAVAIPLDPKKPDPNPYISVGFGLSAIRDADAEGLELPKGVYSGGIGTLAFRDLTTCPPGYDDLGCGHYKAINYDPAPKETSAVCKGDSGGPLLKITASHNVEVVGVTSARVSKDPGCHPTSEAFAEYIDLAWHRDWIRSTAGPALHATPRKTGPKCVDAIWSSGKDETVSIDLPITSKSEISFAVAGVDDAAPPSINLRPVAPDTVCKAILNQRDFFHCSVSENDNQLIGFDITGRGVAQLSVCSIQ